MIDTDERALAVLEAIAAVGPLQVCCGMPVGGGYDENGNGEPPSCCGQPFDGGDLADAIQHLRRRLAQPDQSEPVAWCSIEEGDVVALAFKNTGANICDTPLYTHPDRTQAPGECGEWRPIETAPKDGETPLLLWEAGSAFVGYRGADFPDDAACDAMGTACYPTHWRPLPTPPSVPQNGEQP